MHHRQLLSKTSKILKCQTIVGGDSPNNPSRDITDDIHSYTKNSWEPYQLPQSEWPPLPRTMGRRNLERLLKRKETGPVSQFQACITFHNPPKHPRENRKRTPPPSMLLPWSYLPREQFDPSSDWPNWLTLHKYSLEVHIPHFFTMQAGGKRNMIQKTLFRNQGTQENWIPC